MATEEKPARPLLSERNREIARRSAMNAPPLTDDQITRLRLIFHGSAVAQKTA